MILKIIADETMERIKVHRELESLVTHSSRGSRIQRGILSNYRTGINHSRYIQRTQCNFSGCTECVYSATLSCYVYEKTTLSPWTITFEVLHYPAPPLKIKNRTNFFVRKNEVLERFLVEVFENQTSQLRYKSSHSFARFG